MSIFTCTRMPQFGISIDGDSLSSSDKRSYESSVASLLTLLSVSAVSRAIFHKLKAHSHNVGGARIVPWSSEDAHENGGVCNATGDDPNSDVPDGTWLGMGGVAAVHFSPQSWMNGSCGGGPGARPEEVLFHELVHAARFVGGDLNQIKLTGSMAGYDDEEEFFAILVTNIYMSETGRTGLRRDHKGWASLSPYITSEAFISVPENYRLVRKFCSQHPNIAPMIAKANAAFNPIKAYYDSHWYLRR